MLRKDPGVEAHDLENWVRETIKANLAWVEENILFKSYYDPYWHQVNLLYRQMDGIRDGCHLRSLMEDQPVDSELDEEGLDYEMGILLLNLQADMQELEQQFLMQKNQTPPEAPSSRRLVPAISSALVKAVEDSLGSSDVLVGHARWDNCSALPCRMLKRYHFGFHMVPDSDMMVPGHSVVMSSYAGRNPFRAA